MMKGTGTDLKLLKNYNDMLTSNKSFKRPNKFGATQFIVCHYAGEVEYEVDSFLEKNRDTVSDITNDTFFGSKSKLLSLFFKKELPPVEHGKA